MPRDKPPRRQPPSPVARSPPAMGTARQASPTAALASSRSRAASAAAESVASSGSLPSTIDLGERPTLKIIPGQPTRFPWYEIVHEGRRIVNAEGVELLGPSTQNAGATGSSANPPPFAPHGAVRVVADEPPTNQAADDLQEELGPVPDASAVEVPVAPPLERDAQVQVHCQALLRLSHQYHVYYHRALTDQRDRADPIGCQRAEQEVLDASLAVSHIADQLQYFLGPAPNYPYRQR